MQIKFQNISYFDLFFYHNFNLKSKHPFTFEKLLKIY